MNYTIIKFKSGFEAYALREYFPYTDKPFFKSLDDLLDDNNFRLSLANMFFQLYKDELIFKFNTISKHTYIVPVVYKNKKFSSINKLVCAEIAKFLQIEVLDNYFENIDFPRVDIRDEYTKNEINCNVKINETFKDIPVLLFDCCCSTGSVISEIFKDKLYNENNAFLVYGVRFNASELKNTSVSTVEEYDYVPDITDDNKCGFLIKIYGLFGYKNVEIDLRNDIQIDIGENGFGKSSAARLALLALDYYCNKKEKTKQAIAKYYFEKLDILYYGLDYKNNYYCSLRKSIFYDDMIISKSNLIKINSDLLSDFLNTINKDEYRTIIRKIILDDRSITVDYNKLNLKYRQKKYNFKQIDKIIRKNISTSEENTKLIETCCFDDHYIYFNCAYSRSIVAKPPRDRIEVFNYEQRYDYGYESEVVYSPYEKDSEEEDIRNENRRKFIAELEEDIINRSKFNDKFAFDYDDPEDYNPYYDGDFYDVENEFYQEYDDGYDDDDYEDEFSSYEGNSIFQEEVIEKININAIYYPNLYHFGSVNINYNNGESLKVDLFKDNKILLHKVIEQFEPSEQERTFDYVSGEVSTCLYSLLEKIFEYDETNFDDIMVIEVDHFEMSIRGYLKEHKNDIEKIYKDILYNDFESFSFGIYDVINEEEYNRLSIIINRLLTEGLKTTNDYFIVVGLNLLLKEYNKHIKNDSHLLLEKLINKYLINKRVQVYKNNMTIIDNTGNYIPLDRLSTGEKNLIIIFCLCLLNDDKFIILDEPDISMSVDWQSKLLVDLLKYTTNKYIIVSQSPLLIQKNNLSIFVKRMDFNDDKPTTPFSKTNKSNISNFSEVNNNDNKNNDFNINGMIDNNDEENDNLESDNIMFSDDILPF